MRTAAPSVGAGGEGGGGGGETQAARAVCYVLESAHPQMLHAWPRDPQAGQQHYHEDISEVTEKELTDTFKVRARLRMDAWANGAHARRIMTTRCTARDAHQNPHSTAFHRLLRRRPMCAGTSGWLRCVEWGQGEGGLASAQTWQLLSQTPCWLNTSILRAWMLLRTYISAPHLYVHHRPP